MTTLVLGAALQADAAPTTPTYTGALAADNSVVDFNFTTTTSLLYNFYTTSFSGGMNANGTTTAAGGFDPLLTLFNLGTGKVAGFGGGNGACAGGIGICDDANFSEILAPGSYQLALSEFPNSAVGTLSQGFLFAGDPTTTGDLCGVAGGQFLEADVAPCVQRTANYAVNITSAAVSAPGPVPEPATWMMVLPAMAGAVAAFRRRLA